MKSSYDVVVVGGGNAAMCAALSARESGASVLVLERAPQSERGGNTAFTAGIMRTVYSGVEDVVELVPDLTEEERATSDFGSYSAEQFFDDIARVTQSLADPDLVEVLVTRSFDTLRWMRSKGVRFAPAYGRQAYKVDGRFTFWGGIAVEVHGGGPGLVDSLTKAVNKAGIEIRYKARARSLITDGDRVVGVRVRYRGEIEEIAAGAVILASGGFQANAEWRTRYLGPSWDLAKVRGTRFNTGDGISMALDIGAMPWGHWSGSHAVAWELNAPAFGDLAVGDDFQKHSYPLRDHGQRRRQAVPGRGRRLPQLHLRQVRPSRSWPSPTSSPGRSSTRRSCTCCATSTGSRRSPRSPGHPRRPGREIRWRRRPAVPAYGPRVQRFRRRLVTFDPNDQGRAGDTAGWTCRSQLGQSAWTPPPYEAYAVTCGITFTFGGLRIDTIAQVINSTASPFPACLPAGELVGGIFYFNYPGGTGLTNGAVFGRVAGQSASALMQTRPHLAAGQQA